MTMLACRSIIGILVLCVVLGLAGRAAAAVDTPDYEAYVAQQGQSWGVIARLYQISPEYLATFNGKTTADSLTAGEILRVPVSPAPTQPGQQIPVDMTPLQGIAVGKLINTSPPAPPSPSMPSSSLTPSQFAPPAINAPSPTPTLPSAPPEVPALPSPNQVSGVVGKISIESTAITSQPTGGRVLFSKATRGMDVLVVEISGDSYGVMMADGTTGWVPKVAVEMTTLHKTIDRPTLASAAPPAKATAVKGEAGHPEVVEAAMAYLGTPYRLGGRLPASVDCSLLVQKAFAKCGVKLPRTAAAQYQVGLPVEFDALQPGDRLYFYKGKTDIIGHAGIYMGDGRFIHASSNRGCVAIDDLSNPTYWNIFAGARR